LAGGEVLQMPKLVAGRQIDKNLFLTDGMYVLPLWRHAFTDS
jgi:hypothetical protein